MPLDKKWLTGWEVTRMSGVEACGTDAIIGATIVYIEYGGSFFAEDNEYEYWVEISQDWGYCYCYPDPCTCTPTMTCFARRRKK